MTFMHFACLFVSVRDIEPQFNMDTRVLIDDLAMGVSDDLFEIICDMIV